MLVMSASGKAPGTEETLPPPKQSGEIATGGLEDTVDKVQGDEQDVHIRVSVSMQ